MTISPSLDERFRAAAAAANLLDVPYDLVPDTPVGTLLIWVKRNDEAYGSFLSDAEVAWQKGGMGRLLLQGHRVQNQ